MSLFKSLRRTYIRKSNRSESPSVQINIKLTHCDWVKDIYSAIQDTPLLMSQKTFVMRMISRIVSGKATQGFELNHPLYTSISQDIENNISSLTSIEITDVLFWLKTMRSFNLPSIGTSAVRKMSYKINELCRNDSLTERQTLAYWFDTIRSGIEPELIAKHMETQLSKTTNYLTNDHYRQIFHCMAACKALANEKLIEISVKKFSDTLEDSYHLKDSIAVVGYLEDIKARTYITSGDNFLRKNIEEIQEKLQKLAELDLYIILEAHDKTACFPKEFIEKVIIKIVKNLKYDLKRLSSTFLIKIGSILNKIEFDTTEALELIRDEVIARFNLGTIEAHTMSQWVLQTHNWKIDLTKVIEFSQSYLPKIRRFNDLIDMSHFCTIFAKQSQLEILKVPDEAIILNIRAKSLSTKIVSYMLNQNRLDVDSKKINEFMMEEFKNDFAKDEFHARSALNIIEEIEFDNDDCKEIRDIAVKKIGDSEFSNLNAVLFVANSMDCREIQEYILKFQKEIDGKSFFQSLAKYLKKMDKEKIEVLVNTFPEECDAALLYGLKKIRNREEDGETMKIIGKFPAEKIGKSPIFTENSTVFCENMQKVEGLADLANQLSGYSKPKTHKENN